MLCVCNSNEQPHWEETLRNRAFCISINAFCFVYDFVNQTRNRNDTRKEISAVKREKEDARREYESVVTATLKDVKETASTSLARYSDCLRVLQPLCTTC
ncbi:Hypothetical protein, putative [Bodo saltans]|uniref:Uncharacterized protein n=1 Tax=Bodo saltans TaxID=75058 RepID=A0A0S4KHL1_BODSA|nr:Hypothetical protein, putative [Bodo saltans]|eukprot:CUI10777.1 Hypothetical protein, putative [Bodo saltans]